MSHSWPISPNPKALPSHSQAPSGITLSLQAPQEPPPSLSVSLSPAEPSGANRSHRGADKPSLAQNQHGDLNEKQKLGIFPCPLLMGSFGCRGTTGFPQPGLRSQTTAVRPRGGQPLFQLWLPTRKPRCAQLWFLEHPQAWISAISSVSAWGAADAWPHPEPPRHHAEQSRSDAHGAKPRPQHAGHKALPARMNAFSPVTKQTDLSRKVCMGMSGHPGAFAA